MSLESDIMDQLLVRLDEIATLSSQRRGYTSHDRIVQEQSLPFGQVWNPVTTTEEFPFHEELGTLTFFVELIEVIGNSDVVRTNMEALTIELIRNPTLGGLVRHASVISRGVDERGIEELAIAQAVIECEFFADADETGDTLIVDIAGRASDFQLFLGTVTNADDQIPGAVGLGKSQATNVFALSSVNEAEFPNFFPLDITVFPAQFRVQIYLPKLYIDDAANFTVSYGDGTNLAEYNFFNLAHGWNELILDVSNPDDESPGPVDKSSIVQIVFVINVFDISTTLVKPNELLLNRIYYTARDKAGTDVAPGF